MTIFHFKYFKKILITCTVFLIIIVCYLLTIQNEATNAVHVKGKTKHILYWIKMFGVENYLGKGYEAFENCEIRDCYLTHDTSLLPVESFDAILFHGFEYSFFLHGKPRRRDPRQFYVFVYLEPPNNYGLKRFNSFFNWTLTYKSDSDIIWKYGDFQKNQTNYTPPTSEEINSRTKLAAWFASHCKTPGKREEIVKRIKTHFPVDVYGKCGEMTCDSNQNQFCLEMLEKNYKFYLSFENSYCEDYVTEKLYTVLQMNVIPIVYGGANYTKYAPPNSVINIKDFKTLDDFVSYVKFLDAKYEEYIKFFNWKKEFSVRTGCEPDAVCSLCKKLHEEVKTPKVYHDLEKWWLNMNNVSVCKDIKIG